MPDWLAWVLYTILWLCATYIVDRTAFIRGKRHGMYKWRCPECRALLLSIDPQEILHGSIDHMKGHLDA